AEPVAPHDKQQWETMREDAMREVTTKSVRAWPMYWAPPGKERAIEESPLQRRYGVWTKRDAAFTRFFDDLPPQKVYSKEIDGIRCVILQFISQSPIEMRVYVLHRVGLTKPELNVLTVLDDEHWLDFMTGLPDDFAAEVADSRLQRLNKDAWNK